MWRVVENVAHLPIPGTRFCAVGESRIHAMLLTDRPRDALVIERSASLGLASIGEAGAGPTGRFECVVVPGSPKRRAPLAPCRQSRQHTDIGRACHERALTAMAESGIVDAYLWAVL